MFNLKNLFIFSSFFGCSLVFADQWKPTATLSLGLPQPLSVGFELQKFGHLSYPFIEVGYFPLPLSNERKLTFFSTMLGVRAAPLNSWLFFSVAIGYRKNSIDIGLSSLKVEETVLATSSHLDLSAFFVSAGVGGQFELGKNFFYSFDLGIQIPLKAEAILSFQNLKAQEGADPSLLSAGKNNNIQRLAYLVLPQITLGRFSYVF